MTYYIEYISEQLTVCVAEVEGVKLSEALDAFIEDYCPVHSIVAVRRDDEPK
mgnify:CR=1 FL=1|tara:strand:+ start:2522 stop:2677 length:156 start_codon:yes stop_codon:yes gene_type:complete